MVRRALAEICTDPMLLVLIVVVVVNRDGL